MRGLVKGDAVVVSHDLGNERGVVLSVIGERVSVRFTDGTVSSWGCAVVSRVKDRGILTVGALRALLVGLDAETHVLIGSPSEWGNVSDWLNVSDVVLPDGISYEGLTLFASDTFDPRQF